ncbi:Cytochrome b-c1 complex subunit 7 [Tulasnella sp. JGI-2019a]|nr:Cytochrome b-c1 complex subunit 7 [Tulasnella sp. JGI-2019a]KAG8996540.1 Cytochrome b-c1 complex subunit 7 [Tulasnella sp. JGI-2019a]KAG9039468.1 Cytochrome b-c1 complex subunit 7 [Tulasnella sp. JGI-2019a]
MSYYSLAPMIKQSKGLFKWLKPVADNYAKVVGHRKYGLRYDDLLIEETPSMQKAIGRLTPRESYDRVYRMRVLHQLSVLHTELPKDKWLDPKDDVRYLSPIVEEVEHSEAERKMWDSMDVKVQNK